MLNILKWKYCSGTIKVSKPKKKKKCQKLKLVSLNKHAKIQSINKKISDSVITEKNFADFMRGILILIN